MFCVSDTTDPVFPVLQRLVQDYPQRSIRILIGTDHIAANDKVVKLARLVEEASHEYLVISDSDVRVEPDYLQRLIAPLANPSVGAVTCFYVPVAETGWVQRLQDVGMLSDFYAGILVAKQLDGVKFALGPTIATTRTRLQAFGGYSAIENRPADDLLVGRLIADQGCEVVLLPYAIGTVPDYQSLGELFHKRLRWITVMRHMRPWGHLGLIFTLGLPWVLLAVTLRPTFGIAAAYLGGYLVVRSVLTLLIGAWGLKQPGVCGKLALIPLWDIMASLLWLISFTRKTIRWRGNDYLVRKGDLIPIQSNVSINKSSSETVP
jgi:ceramide glucosyltransferase